MHTSIEAKEIDCGSDNELNKDNIETPKAEPHQKPVAIVEKNTSKLENQSKNAATASQEPSTTSS
eukprot:6334093-Ditylum_brightwellii.AAC.1